MTFTQPRPSAVIFGAPRSGTTSLWRYMAQHPDIAESRVKELDFFVDPLADVTAYASGFPGPGAVTLEASPVYFREHEAILPRLAAGLPEARLICILREPAARLVANYRSQRDWYNRVAPTMDFEQFARIVVEERDPAPINPGDPQAAAYVRDGCKVGLYAEILEHYLQHYRADQILVLFLDDMKADARAVTCRALSHSGLDPQRLPNLEFAAENQGVNIRNAALFRKLRKVNAALEPLFNRLPALRKMAKTLHNRVNGAPADLHASAESAGSALLREWYRPANRRLGELIARTWPDTPLPRWITEG